MTDLARWLDFLGLRRGEWVELQALGVANGRGFEVNKFAHVDNSDDTIRLIGELDRPGTMGLFVLGNRIDPAVSSRAERGRWHQIPKGAGTTDRDITHRRVLFVDVDAVRPKGTSATAEELARTEPVAQAVYDRIAGILGDEAPLGMGHSGNGRAVFVALDNLPESEEVARLVRGTVAALGAVYSTPEVHIDPAVTDAKRLMPAFGSVKRKGAAGIPERPHRRTSFACAGKVRRLGLDELTRLHDILVGELTVEQRAVYDKAMGVRQQAPAGSRQSSGAPEDDPFRRANQCDPREVAMRLGLLDGDDLKCPGCGTVGDSSVAIVDGGMKCQHATCADKGPRGCPGFRTCVDMVAEVKRCKPIEAVRQLGEWFGFEVPARKRERKTAGKRPRAERSASLQKSPDGWFELTDTGNAERLVARHGRDLRYVHAWQKWLTWDGRRWAVDDTAEVDRRAKDTVRAIYEQAADTSDDGLRMTLATHAKRSESAGARAAMLKLATSELGIPVRPEELDLDPWLLNVANGTVDLRTGELRPHRREDLLTKCLEIPWQAEAECQRWVQFLAEVMDDNQALVDFLQRAIGYTLTGSIREQVLFFLIGVGSNGKSTFTGALRALFGELGVQAVADLLLEKRGESHPTERADLFGRRLVVCSEIEQGRRWAESLLKEMTGGEPVRARRMREDFWQFEPVHKFWLCSNHKPIVRGTDHAIWRRLLLVPFKVIFAGDRKDLELPEKLRAELPGILRWAVDGCLAWQRAGLQPPAEVLAEVAKYRDEMDVLGQFLAECIKHDRVAELRAGDLFGAYCAWCDKNHEKAVNQTVFGRSLVEDRGFVKETKNGRPKYIGVRFRRDDETCDSCDSCDSFPDNPTRNSNQAAIPENCSNPRNPRTLETDGEVPLEDDETGLTDPPRWWS